MFDESSCQVSLPALLLTFESTFESILPASFVLLSYDINTYLLINTFVLLSKVDYIILSYDIIIRQSLKGMPFLPGEH